MNSWIIIDWAGNRMFGWHSFPDFDSADDYLSEQLGDRYPDDSEYEDNRQEYVICQKHEVRSL